MNIYYVKDMLQTTILSESISLLFYSGKRLDLESSIAVIFILHWTDANVKSQTVQHITLLQL